VDDRFITTLADDLAKGATKDVSSEK
jgi:hypothetical protein